MLTMLIGGLWHGANWTFVVWGGLHGAYLAVERMLGIGRERADDRRSAPLSWADARRRAWCSPSTWSTLAWIFFRAADRRIGARRICAASLRFDHLARVGPLPFVAGAGDARDRHPAVRRPVAIRCSCACRGGCSRRLYAGALPGADPLRRQRGPVHLLPVLVRVGHGSRDDAWRRVTSG